MASAKRTERVMCKGGSAVRRYTMTTIVEILPSAKKLYSSSSWKSRRPTVSSSEAPQVRVRDAWFPTSVPPDKWFMLDADRGCVFSHPIQFTI
jgi:hypothetical protein